MFCLNNPIGPYLTWVGDNARIPLAKMHRIGHLDLSVKATRAVGIGEVYVCEKREDPTACWMENG